MAYDRKDHFYRKAKREGKASRASYKLSELQKRFRLVRTGEVALDLGCAPGGWMQELSKMVGPKGKVVGVDLLPLKISLPVNCTFIQGDMDDGKIQSEVHEAINGSADAVLSDMSPNLSGISFRDSYLSYETAMLALSMCDKFLKVSGAFVVKIFPGDEFQNFVSTLKKKFDEVKVIIPEATRKTSSERYIVAVGFKR